VCPTHDKTQSESGNASPVMSVMRASGSLGAAERVIRVY
jgi:hypothetical protein